MNCDESPGTVVGRLGLVLNFEPGGLEGDIAGARGIGFGFAFLPVALQRGTEMGLVLNSALGVAVRCGGAPAPPEREIGFGFEFVLYGLWMDA